MTLKITKISALFLAFMISVCCCGCVFFDAPQSDGISDGPPVETPDAPDGVNDTDRDKGDYFFDGNAAAGGNGSYDAPFNTLTALTELTLTAGQTVCLKGSFTGGLILEGICGTQDSPVTVTNYGGTVPVIDGGGISGENTAVVALKNCSYITVENLEITDSAAEEGDRRGVLVTADGGFTGYSVNLRNLYVHDIKGITDEDNTGMSAASKRTGGIHVWTNDGTGRFDGLTVTDCVIKNVSNVGIATWYRPGTSSEYKISPYDTAAFAEHSYTNVVIAGNDVGFTGKNAIFVRNLSGGIVERNTVHDTNYICYSGNSICTSYVDGTVVQYNEGYSNNARSDGNGNFADGCMLDADLQSKDTVWQYNYSHDNSFGLFETCTDARDCVTVRYNLSVADRGNKGIIYLNYASQKVDIYNNTIVTVSDDVPVILQTNDKYARSYSFFNNIIYNSSPSAKIRADFTVADVEYNLLFNNGYGAVEYLTDDFGLYNSNAITVSPQFSSSVPVNLAARTGFVAAEFAKLKTSSPALTAGRRVEGVEKDFFGNAYAPSVGCYSG